MSWIMEHCRWLGVDHVFLTDNDSDDGAWLVETLANEFSTSFLTLRQDDTPKSQLKTYAWCAEEQRTSFNWLAFFDLDEVLAS
jgi:Glycosyl transferase family 2